MIFRPQSGSTVPCWLGSELLQRQEILTRVFSRKLRRKTCCAQRQHRLVSEWVLPPSTTRDPSLPVALETKAQLQKRETYVPGPAGSKLLLGWLTPVTKSVMAQHSRDCTLELGSNQHLVCKGSTQTPCKESKRTGQPPISGQPLLTTLIVKKPSRFSFAPVALPWQVLHCTRVPWSKLSHVAPLSKGMPKKRFSILLILWLMTVTNPE